MKLEELNLNLKDKNLLRELAEPKTIAQCAAIMETSYNYISTKLKVLLARNLVKKLKRNKETRYYLNQDEITL